jgi:hypothetical protein
MKSLKRKIGLNPKGSIITGGWELGIKKRKRRDNG